jgi:hypothetical protein
MGTDRPIHCPRQAKPPRVDVCLRGGAFASGKQIGMTVRDANTRIDGQVSSRRRGRYDDFALARGVESPLFVDVVATAQVLARVAARRVAEQGRCCPECARGARRSAASRDLNG